MVYTRLSLGLSPETIARIDERRGAVARERWLRDLIEAEVSGPLPVDDSIDLLERGRILAAERDAERPSQPKPQPAPNPPQTPPPPPKPIVETRSHTFAAVPGSFRCKVCGMKQASHA